MATIMQYASGQASKAVKFAVDAIKSTNGSILNTEQGQRIIDTAKRSKPFYVNEKQAVDFINKAKRCAAGERICKCMYQDVPLSESIFIDELAEAMIEAGKATAVSKQVATSVLKRYRQFPIIVSEVSSKYMEICRSWPQTCVYWNMEKYNIRCLNRMNSNIDPFTRNNGLDTDESK